MKDESSTAVATTGRTIWLVRHGHRRDFENDSWTITAARPHDPPLSERGVVQAQEVARRLKHEQIDGIFASPFLRAIETASQIASTLNLPIHVEHGLCELLFSNWFPREPDYLPLAELKEAHPQLDLDYQSMVQPVYPETEEMIEKRTAAAIRHLVEAHAGNLLIVAHGGSLWGLCRALAGPGVTLHTATCCLVKMVEHESTSWKVEADGSDTSHLSFTEETIRLN